MADKRKDSGNDNKDGKTVGSNGDRKLKRNDQVEETKSRETAN